MGVKYLPRMQTGGEVYGPPAPAWWPGSPTPTSPTAPVSSAAAQAIADLQAQFGINGSSSSQGSSWSSTPALPPVLELLQEMRERRNSLATRQEIIATILGGNVPQGQNNYLGFEPGGVADILMGLISGEGPSAGARILPADQRMVRRQRLAVPGNEPEVGGEAGGAMSLAQQILNAIRVISTGGSSQSSGSTQTAAAPPVGSSVSPSYAAQQTVRN